MRDFDGLLHKEGINANLAKRFLDAVEGNGSDPAVALGEYVVAMRKDASMGSALFPRFWNTRLLPSAFRFRSAKVTS